MAQLLRGLLKTALTVTYKNISVAVWAPGIRIMGLLIIYLFIHTLSVLLKLLCWRFFCTDTIFSLFIINRLVFL